MIRKAILAIAGIAFLAACTSPQQQQRNRLARQAERTLDRIDRDEPRADPGLVAASDLAFAKAGRENGRWEAMLRYGANGAVVHTSEGLLTISEATPAQLSEDEPAQWVPRAIWTSCNGRMAVSQGKFLTTQGLSGTYATVWQRQGQRDTPYKFVYTASTIDDPQPAARDDRDTPAGDDVIIVEQVTAITALAADCPRDDAPLPSPPAFVPSADAKTQQVISDDRTLQWDWAQYADKRRSFTAHVVRDGVWEQVIHLTGPSQRVEPR